MKLCPRHGDTMKLVQWEYPQVGEIITFWRCQVVGCGFMRPCKYGRRVRKRKAKK